MVNENKGTNVDSRSSEQLGLRGILSILIRRKYVVLGVMLPVMIMATLGTLKTTDFATASSKVMIEGASITDPSFRKLSVDYDVMMSSASQLAISMPVAEIAAEAIWDSVLVLEQEDREFVGFTDVKQLRNELKSGIEAIQVGESNILELKFVHINPYFAVISVGAMTDAYINFNVSNVQNTRALDYYTEQIEELSSEIDSLMIRRADIFTDAGYTTLKSNMSAGISHIKGLEYSYFTTYSDRVALASRIKTIKEQIKENDEFVPSIQQGDNESLVGAKSNLDRQRLELAKLRKSYTEDSIWVQRQQELVQFAKQELKAAQNNYISDLEVSFQQIEKKEEALKEAVDIQKADLVGYPEVERQVASLDMRIDTQRDLLETLQMKRGEVKLSAESDLRISNITRLDKPQLISNVTGGKKIIYIIMAGIVGLALGLVMALFVENQDDRIYDNRQASQLLGIPVLGSIAQISNMNDRAPGSS